jgi:predicted HicB family RNase H-like nuclease
MAGSEEVVWIQLATRIPKALHRELKLHCVTAETSVMDFVMKAIEEKLASSASTPAKRRRTKA